MKASFKRKVLVLFWLVLAPLSAGCVPLIIGAAAGVGGYVWANGEMVKEYPVSAEKLYRAALRGVKSLDLAIAEQKSDRLSGKVTATFSDGKKVDVIIEAVTERSARLKVRVGLFGDKMRSEMVLSAVEKNM